MPTAVIAPPNHVQHPDADLGPRAPERIVLGHLLDQHPRRLTLMQLAREVGNDLSDWQVERAVDNLSAAYFLSHQEGKVVPTAAVVQFDRTPVGTAPR